MEFRPRSPPQVGESVCTIPRIPEENLSALDFLHHYWRQRPIILQRSPTINQAAQRYTRKDQLLRQFNHTPVRLATYQSYAHDFDADHPKQALGDYLHQLSSKRATYNTTTAAANTSYAFGADPYQVGDKHYVVPKVIQELQQQQQQSTETVLPNALEWHYQVAIAARGGGLNFHWHADVVAETLHGRRRWFLAPPQWSPVFSPRETSAQWWMRQLLAEQQQPPQQQSSNNKEEEEEEQERKEHKLLQCTIGPNEAIYVPADWFHATLSLGEAVSITTTFSKTFRNDIRQKNNTRFLDSGTLVHSSMLDALGERDYPRAIYFGEQLVQSRPKNFVSHGWLGIIQTLYVQSLNKNNKSNGGTASSLQTKTNQQHLDLEALIVETLQAARASTRTCTELNPLFAPCHVWLARQCTALAALEKSAVAAAAYRAQARQAHDRAASLGNPNDDEMLDPRWKPRNGGGASTSDDSS